MCEHKTQKQSGHFSHLVEIIVRRDTGPQGDIVSHFQIKLMQGFVDLADIGWLHGFQVVNNQGQMTSLADMRHDANVVDLALD